MDRCRFGLSCKITLRDDLASFCNRVQDHRQPEVLTPVESASVLVTLVLAESAESGQDVEIREWNTGLRRDFVGASYGSNASDFSGPKIPSMIFRTGRIDRPYASVEYVEYERVDQLFES